MIETPRLVLREITEGDAPALLAIYRDPAVARFLGPPPGSLEAERANIAAHRARYYARRGYGLWAVVRRDTGELVGRCGLLDAEIAGREEVEVSYLLAPPYWGRGLATEAAGAALAYAAGPLALDRVVAVIAPENARSRRVAERLGMRREGVVQYKAFGAVDLFAWQGPGRA